MVSVILGFLNSFGYRRSTLFINFQQRELNFARNISIISTATDTQTLSHIFTKYRMVHLFMLIGNIHSFVAHRCTLFISFSFTAGCA